jgi:hypothetical protein
MTTELESTDLGERIDTSFGEGPPQRPVQERIRAGRRVVRRRRRLTASAASALLVGLVLGSVLFRPETGGGGGGIDLPTPVPDATQAPTPVHLLVAPARYVSPTTPPVLYLYGRMFKRDRDVKVLATYGEIDISTHPRGAAIVQVGGHTLWVAVVGNEPDRLVLQRTAAYNYQAFMDWAQLEFPLLSGEQSLAATAPGRYAPVSAAASPAEFALHQLVAKPGGTVRQRIRHPLANAQDVPPCHAQAVRIHTHGGDWFAIGFDCRGVSGVYSERVGVRADTLPSWLAAVKQVQDQFAS